MWVAVVITIILVIIILAKRKHLSFRVIILNFLNIARYVLIRSNNYVLISRNTTFTYEILKNDFKDCFPDEDSILTTSAVINTLEYLQKGLLDIEKIKDGVQSARVGQCHFGLGYQAKLYENSAELFLRDEQKNLLWYIMQLEAWIFSVDSNYSPESILHAIITKKEVIRKTIETTQKKYKRIGAPKLRKLGVYCFMSRLRFAELRKELGIICSHEDGKPKQCDIEPLAVPKAPERGTGCFSDTYTESEAINDYDQEWGDFEEDEYDWEVSELLRKYLKTFSQIEKRVFILDSCDELTVNEIASTLKLSEAQVSEILRKISDHLRTTRE